MEDQLRLLLNKDNLTDESILQIIHSYIAIGSSRNEEKIKEYLSEIRQKLSSYQKSYSKFLILGLEGAAAFYLNDYKNAESKLNEALLGGESSLPKDYVGFLRITLGTNYRSLGITDLAVENLIIATELIDKKGLFQRYYLLSYYQLGLKYIWI